MENFIRSVWNTLQFLREQKVELTPEVKEDYSLATNLTSSASFWLAYFLNRTVFKYAKLVNLDIEYSDYSALNDDKLFPTNDKDIASFILLSKDTLYLTHDWDATLGINFSDGSIVFEIGNTYSILKHVHSKQEFDISSKIRQKIRSLADNDVQDFKVFVEKLKYDIYNLSCLLYQNIPTPYPFIVIRKNKLYTKINEEEWLK